MKLPAKQRKGLLIQREKSSMLNDLGDSKRWNYQKYDEATGQVYTERTAAILGANDRDWTRQTRIVYGRNQYDELQQSEVAAAWERRRNRGTGDHLTPTSTRRGGARSLQNIAMEKLIQNISDVTADSFEFLPITLIKRIWDVTRKRCFVSFETWALFSKLLHSEDYISEDLLQYAEAFSTPKLPLEMYITPLISDSFDFITSLCITTPFAVPDLMKISSIRNLGVLEIINTDTPSTGYAQTGVSDRLIRAWHLAATKDGAFPILRVLRLWNHEDLTSQSLAFVGGFPSLAVYDVRGCQFDQKDKVEARSLGWKLSIETDVLKLLERSCFKRAEALAKHTPAGSGRTTEPKSSGQAVITRIRRNELASFLANRSPPGERNGGILASHPSFPRRSQNIMERVIHMEGSYTAQKHQKLDAWESTAYKTYARIGELRSDTDIERVRMLAEDVATSGDELLIPLPMAMLRLGKSTLGLTPATRTSVHAISFVRIETPPVQQLQTRNDADASTERESALKLPQRSQPPTVARTSSNTTAQPTLQKNKKRSLNDMLSSFM